MVLVQIVLPPLMTLFFGITLIRFLQTLDVPMAEWWPRDLPEIIQVALMLLVAEFFRYWLHVAAHNTKLWQLHAVHHSPKKLYWLNVGRFHPVEKALQYLLDALPFILIGVGEQVFAGYLIFYAVNDSFNIQTSMLATEFSTMWSAAPSSTDGTTRIGSRNRTTTTGTTSSFGTSFFAAGFCPRIGAWVIWDFSTPIILWPS